ncbi:MAG: hypothetical protein ACOX47_13090 [Bacillota bacterium]
MSRAFVSENDGWHRCTKYMEDCMMADEHGKCVLDHCRQHPEKDKKKESTVLSKEKQSQ